MNKAFEIERGCLVIRLKLRTPKLSNSGKTRVIASTRGFRITRLQFRGKSVYVIANACIRKEGKERRRPTRKK